MIQRLIEQSAVVGNAIRNWFYPFYLMGRAAEGDLSSMLLFTAEVAILFSLVYFILSKIFSQKLS